jgi:hypothetical protein
VLLLHESPWQQSSDAQLSPEAAQRGVLEHVP